MTQPENRKQAADKLAALIAEVPVAMLTTCRQDHSLTSRPMVNVNTNFEGDLWFFTHRDDPKAHELRSNPQVNVNFADPKHKRYISVSGWAELVVDDQKRIELLWTKACQTWFPQGADDPQLALIKVDVHHAEYWDEQSNAMQAIVGFFQRDKSEGPAMKHEKIDW